MRPPECRHPANGLLPWYVKGTLQGTEREWVRDHVESCDICSDECDALARSSDEIVTQAAPPARPARPRLPYILAAALLLPATLGVYCAWFELGGISRHVPHELVSTAYLDLGTGPTRAAEPLKSLQLPDDIGSVVISFFVPISADGAYAFDLDGPHGKALVRKQPIRGIDQMGRCTFAFPPGLISTIGEYAILVRVASPDGASRLYPYPFEVIPGDVQASKVVR